MATQTATIALNSGTLVQEVAKVGRVPRRPVHDFNLRIPPWGIQPFMIAPVLPGETMKNALIQAKVVTDALKSPLIGWHAEFYLFYVKLRDLPIRDELVEMLMDPSKRAPRWQVRGGQNGGVDTNVAHHDGPNYTRRCLDRVVECYFRAEGDNPGNLFRDKTDLSVTPGLPPATVQTRDYWHDSAKLASAMPHDDTEIPGDQAHKPDIAPGFEAHYQQWEAMRALRLVDATFDDWLKQFGVRVPKAEQEEEHKPELLRYVRDWTYPTNAFDPALKTAAPSCQWSIAERADKDRFFKEPGFVFGVTVCRPKIYLGRQHNRAVDMLNDAYSWLPAILSSDPYTSLKKFGTNEGPLGHTVNGDHRIGEDYWVDARDLFLYGDSMASQPFDQTDGANVIQLPARDMQKRYPDDAMCNSVFADATRNKIRMDGVVNLDILGAQRDTT